MKEGQLPLISALDLRPQDMFMEQVQQTRENDIFGSPEHWQMVHQKPQAEGPLESSTAIPMRDGEWHPIQSFKIRLDAMKSARRGR